MQEARAGILKINSATTDVDVETPFGGWKASLFGDTHVHGVEGVHFFTRGKVVTSRWPDHTRAGLDLGFPTAR